MSVGVLINTDNNIPSFNVQTQILHNIITYTPSSHLRISLTLIRPSNNRSRFLLRYLGRYWCSTQIIWYCERFADQSQICWTARRLIGVAEINIQHVWSLGFKTGMITSGLCNHTSQWERSQLKVTEKHFFKVQIKKWKSNQKRSVFRFWQFPLSFFLCIEEWRALCTLHFGWNQK